MSCEEKMVLFHTDKTASISKLTMLKKSTIEILSKFDICTIEDLCESYILGSRVEGIHDDEMYKLRSIASFYQQQCA